MLILSCQKGVKGSKTKLLLTAPTEHSIFRAHCVCAETADGERPIVVGIFLQSLKVMEGSKWMVGN
ncbi:hypothetical protein AA0229_0256 [Gluconobacter cerinus NRIC 0229]|nr:hypothetical protein AA0229_0256 [Gluconobacter cerinus NRIC 0229]